MLNVEMTEPMLLSYVDKVLHRNKDTASLVSSSATDPIRLDRIVVSMGVLDTEITAFEEVSPDC
eukprot:15331405-Ditylum_brightwellii.AAC.1